MLHNKAGFSALCILHEVIALCLGCREAGRSVFPKRIHGTLPAGHPLFLSLRTAHLYRQRRKWMIFMGYFFVWG